ncbi:MAG: hypothetical protein AVDCRST_MAG88-4743 [uncultured Thermomicrobiales bacterium]|uniref:Uncharacterized protein n=1 Tax=uncultured Thermomicrobiales bacterium TaxID=1645740 RepID=A0A6J4VV27_9BACT|nr:MAG: hypothetical protein AVDCRST_MAG88-4743 [uncultured Thermomicrobiales bacterium]
MQQSSGQLIGAAARVSVPYAAGFAAVLTLTGLIPCCGLLVFPAGSALIGYLVAPKLHSFMPPGETTTNNALYSGVGVGAAAMVALVIAAIVGGILSIALGGVISGLTGNFGDFAPAAAGGVVGLIGGIFGAIIGGAIFGTIFGFLGSYLALNRGTSAGTARPF